MLFLNKLKQALRNRRLNFFRRLKSEDLSDLKQRRRLHQFKDVLSKKETKNLLILPTEVYGTLLFDYCEPNFDILTYSYSAKTYEASRKFGHDEKRIKHLALETEFYGQSLMHLVNDLCKRKDYNQFLILNGDIIISWKDIKTCFSMASMHSLDMFQPSLSLDSYYSHEHLLNKPGYFLEQVEFTEIMMLGISRRLLEAWAETKIFNISGWGIDNHLLPRLITNNSFNPPTLIHNSIGKHCKPVESSERIFSNSKTALIEMNELKMLLGE